MTAFSLASRRMMDRLALNWVQRLAVLALLIALAAAGWMAGYGAESRVAAAPAGNNALVHPAKAAELVAATSAAAEVRATGDAAKLINAALPFSRDPVEAAAGFSLAGNGTDHGRALLCLTQAVYYEAGFEPLTGRRAVAQVVLNRMRHPAFPKSVCGVVYQGSSSPVCQFSFVCDGSLYRAPAAAAWRQARDIAASALAGHVEASVGAATHYHADYVAPYWAPKLSKVEKIGSHIFYRWPGAWGRRASFTGRYIGEPRDPLALRPPLLVAKDADTLDPAEALVVAESGPPVARAPNDVGGLLDVSKGWTLTIPDPRDIDRRSASTMAAQQPAPPVPAAVAVAAPITAAQ